VNDTILFRKKPLKAQNDYIFLKFWGAWPLRPPLAAPIGGVLEGEDGGGPKNTMPLFYHC